jgi:SAM-dependent methyltransferase
MNLRRIRFKLRRSLAERGLRGTLSLLWKKALRPPGTSTDQPKEYVAVHPFDQQFGVDTSGLMAAEELLSNAGNTELYNAGYFGVAPSAFRNMLERLRPPFEQYTFVDLGSGKGRAMLIASEYPFRAICGVEISPRLHAIAIDNLARYSNPKQQCRNITAILGDATAYSFPPGPLLVYMWNPFEGPVFTSVLANLESSLAREPRDIIVLYVQPNQEEHLAASRHWRELWHHDFEMNEEDYAACAFPTRAEPCTAFRSVLSA